MDRHLVCWLAYKNLPLTFFNDDTTKNFFSIFNPNFKIPNRNQVSNMTPKEYEKMRENIKQILKKNSSKFAFTVDGWSARTRKSYYGFSVHFIDEEWNLQSVTLEFVLSKGKHKGIDIANIFFDVIQDFEIADKIIGITLDNTSSNLKFIRELGKKLKEINIKFCYIEQHFKCLSHVLNLAVHDVLKLISVNIFESTDDEDNDDNDSHDEIYDSDDDLSFEEEDEEETNEGEIAALKELSHIVYKIRLLHKKIRNSEALQGKMEACCKVCEIKSKMPTLDCKTRWNSTLEMLSCSVYLKDALNMLCASNKDLKELEVKSSEWTFVEKIIDFLEDFKTLSETISGEKYVTLSRAIVGFNCLLDKIEKKCFELDEKETRNLIDEHLIKAFQKGRDKLIKHYKKCNWIYCVALILDPRIKSDGLDETEWSIEMKGQTLKTFKELYKKYYEQYKQQNTDQEPLPKKRKIDKNENKKGNSIDFGILFLKKNNSLEWEKEINRYLESQRADSDCDILEWWKNHSKVYPVLSRMARDILCVQATSTPVERLFSEAALTVTKNRCSLSDKNIQALICVNMWMKNTLKKNICEVEI